MLGLLLLLSVLLNATLLIYIWMCAYSDRLLDEMRAQYGSPEPEIAKAIERIERKRRGY